MDISAIGAVTGFKDKDLKGLLMATTELPGVLPDVDLDASGMDKADFLVVQFPSKEAMAQFKERVPTTSKHPRVIAYEELMKVMTWTMSAIKPKPALTLKRKAKS